MQRTDVEDNKPDRQVRLKALQLVYAQQDLQIALSAADFLWGTDPDEPLESLKELRRVRCYEQAMVISYGRAFKKAQWGGTKPQGERLHLPALTMEELGIQPQEAEQQLHDKLLAMRDQEIAHSDHSKMRAKVSVEAPLSRPDGSPLYLPIASFDEGVHFVGWEGTRPLIEWLRKLIGALAKKIMDDVQANPDAYDIHVDYRDPKAPGC